MAILGLPSEISDPFESAARLVRGIPSEPDLPGFTGSVLPSPTGVGSRQNAIPAGRSAVNSRNIMHWFIPEVGVVEMYVNPEQVKYSYKKDINSKRTKGGFNLQYWGEALTRLALNGTTGSSGVEGINVLHDIYRSEQVSFEPFALTLASAAQETNAIDDLGEIGQTLLGVFNDVVQTGNVATRSAPTLASLAFSVELYYSGWIFRGYFEDFVITESVNKLGLFDYSTNFVVTQRRGLRLNYLPWHRSANNGPSNSSHPTVGGVPFSYDSVAHPLVSTSNNAGQPATRTGIELLGDGLSEIF